MVYTPLPIRGLFGRSAALPLIIGALVAWLEVSVETIQLLVPADWQGFVPIGVAAVVWLYRHFFGGLRRQSVSALDVEMSPAPVIPVRVSRDGTQTPVE